MDAAAGGRGTIICQVGQPRIPIDLAGLTRIDIGTSPSKRARVELVRWA